MLPLTLTVITELSGEHREANLSLLDISTSDLDEDIAGVCSDLCLLRVDDGRKREHLPILIVENGVLVEWFKDWQELLHLYVLLEHFKQGCSVHSFSLLQGLEDDLIRWQRFISNRSSNLVQVMRTHRCKRSPAADVLVKFVLKVDERVVVRDVESNVPQNAGDHTWSHFGSLSLDDNLLEGIRLILYGEPRLGIHT